MALKATSAACGRAASRTYVAAPCSHLPAPRAAAIVCRAQSFSKDFMDLNQTLDALISKVQSAPSTASSPSSSGPAPSNVESPLDGYVCDENGCVLVAPKGPSRSAPEDSSDGPVLEELLSGCDWSLGLRTDMDPDGYCAVVGGSEWEVSMTAQELKDFVTALMAIRAALNALIVKQPDSSSPLRAKWDLRTVIMEATATPSAQQDDFQLTFMIGAGGLRAITGRWSRSTVADVMRTLDAQLPGFAPAGEAAAAAAPSAQQQQAPATAAAR